MAPEFRYRYVDIGTVFTGDSHTRDAQNGADHPTVLYANELACDVGGTCWGANEPLAILDHHLSHEARFPSASAAVLHKAKLIRERFTRPADLLWLVTHKEPDFDAFCSMYLARWLIEDPAAAADWEVYGLHPDGWHGLAGGRKIDWFDPDLSGVPAEHRWPILLASYASRLEMRHHIACRRERSLRSVLYAALKRGRDYLNASSGATEFFDEVKAVLQEQQLNPAFDSVLENSARFAPELAMLDREGQAYPRDLQRARKALVYLPESEAPSPDFFQQPKASAAQLADDPEAGAAHLLLADTFRIPTDGIYLRDPECVLFREWARLDLENSALGAGFEFTAIAQSNGRRAAAVNHTEYAFSIDPERANGRHLYTVWSRLQTEEVEALRARRIAGGFTLAGTHSSDTSAQHPGTLEALLADPWSGGQSQSSTMVDAPMRGTLVGPPGRRSDLRDDPIAEAVRTELENSIYSPASLIAGPQVAIFDFSGLRDRDDVQPRYFDLNAALKFPAAQPGYFRFARVGLRSDVPIGSDGLQGHRLVQQIGDTLWQALYPERPGEVPADFERNLIVSTDAVGVCSERGIAIAVKKLPPADSDRAEAELRRFASMVRFAGDVEELAAHLNALKQEVDASTREYSRTPRRSEARDLVASGEALVRRALQIQQTLTLPDHELLRRFAEAIGLERLISSLRDLNQVAAEHLRREEVVEETRRAEKRSEHVGHVQQKLKRLQVVVFGFIALVIVRMILRYAGLSGNEQQTLALFGAPLTLAGAAWILQPWKRRQGATPKADEGFDWILIVAALIWLVAWLAQVLRA